jgi:putative transposase
MPRAARRIERNVVYHVYNRRNERQTLFATDDDFRRFVEWLHEGKARYAVRLHAYSLMKTHWHLALSAEIPERLGGYVGWIATKHAVRFRLESGTHGHGHVYQGRFCSVAVVDIVQYVRLIRYIEANAHSAGLVARAEDWRWCSLPARLIDGGFLDAGPWRLPADWCRVVNTPDVQIEMLAELAGQKAAFRPDPIAFH